MLGRVRVIPSFKSRMIPNLISAQQIAEDSARQTIERYIEERHLETSFGGLLRSFDLQTVDLICKLIRQLAPSGNALKGLIGLADEIALRDGKSLKDIFSDEELLEILGTEILGRKDKLARIRDYLELIRYPERSELEGKVARLTRELKAEFNLKLILPDELEGDAIEIKVSSRGPEELRGIAERITELSKSTKLRELFSILKGEL
jgi:hypothetical protein